MNNILITIGVLIVAVLSALFAVPYFVDWNGYRGVIEEEASRIVGRDVRIGGDIKLQLLPAPSFVIEKLRVADVATGSGEPLFRADRVDAKLSIVPLARGILEANQIELVKPVLRFVVDDAGQGNWRSLSRGTVSPHFMPNDVALQSVKITDGTFSVFDRSGARERIVLTHIGGQVSAPALEGPYRFRGTFGEGQGGRDLRFTTLPPDADGVVQFKVNLKDLASNAAATLDGRLRDLGGQPQLTGELSAVFPLLDAASGQPAGAKPLSTPTADLKANIVGNATEVSLNQLSVAFEGSGRPEVLAGGAIISWQGQRTLVTKLAAPWIDLDNVLGNPKGANPLLALANFAQRINGLGSNLGAATAVLEIDQASLGHDSVGGIHIEARSSGGVLAVEQLRASLPGGTKVEIQGRIAGEGGATTFDGDLTMSGTSLARAAGWATAGRTVISSANDVPFRMRGRLTSEPARAGLRDIFAEVGDSTIEGEIDYAWTGARKLRVALDGPRIDARSLAPDTFSLQSLSTALSDAADKPAAGPAISVSLKTAELVLPDQILRDVSASLDSSGGALVVQRLQFSGDHGVAVSLDGRLGGASQLRGAIAAADPEGLKMLSEFLGFPLHVLVSQNMLPDVLPLRLAGTISPPAVPGAKGAVVTLDGRLGLADTKITVALGAGRDAWRTAAADVDLVMLAPADAQLAAKLLAALRLETLAQPTSPFPLGPASAAATSADKTGTASTRLALRATGIPADGLATAARFDSPELTAYIDGLAHVSAAGSIHLTGDLTIDARDSRAALDALSGLRLGLTDPLVLQGTARITARDGGVTLGKIALSNGSGERISGRLAFAPPPLGGTAAAETRQINGELTLSALELETLLAPVLVSRSAEQQAAIKVAAGRAGVWPDANFDFRRNRSVAATVTLNAERLSIGDDIGLTDVGLTLVNRSGGLEIRDLKGAGLGGRLRGTATIMGTPTGAAVNAKFDLAGANLAKFGGSGTADVSVDLSGTGINPAGIVSAMSGKGVLKLAAATAREIAPETLQAAIDTALKAPSETVVGVLRSTLAADIARVPVAIGTRTVDIAAQDGVGRIAPLTIASGAGRVSGSLALDFATFALSGDWRVETRMPPLPVAPSLPGQPIVAPQPTPATMLPPVVSRFTFAPSQLGSAKLGRRQNLETEPLERELAVRKVEHDLAELERLRRLDEERAAARLREEAAAEAAKTWQSETRTITSPTEPPVQRQ